MSAQNLGADPEKIKSSTTSPKHLQIPLVVPPERSNSCPVASIGPVGKRVKMSDSFLAAKVQVQQTQTLFNSSLGRSASNVDIVYPESDMIGMTKRNDREADDFIVEHFAPLSVTSSHEHDSKPNRCHSQRKIKSARRTCPVQKKKLAAGITNCDVSVVSSGKSDSNTHGEFDEEDDDDDDDLDDVDLDNSDMDEEGEELEVDVDENDLDGFQNSKPRFICRFEDCNQTFKTRKELRRHKLNHRVRKHVCPIPDCGRGFFEKSKLSRHMVVHTKKKEFKCPMCDKKFGYKANVKTHLRTHTGERPFVCRIGNCGKSFAQASNRNAHEKTHYKTPEKRKSSKLMAKISASADELIQKVIPDIISPATKRIKSADDVEISLAPGTKRKTRKVSNDAVTKPLILSRKSSKEEPEAESGSPGVRNAQTIVSELLPQNLSFQASSFFAPQVNHSIPNPNQLALTAPSFTALHNDSHALGLQSFGFDDQLSGGMIPENLMFTSFTSLGSGPNHDREFGSMLKSDFGMHLENLLETTDQVFGNSFSGGFDFNQYSVPRLGRHPTSHSHGGESSSAALSLPSPRGRSFEDHHYASRSREQNKQNHRS